MSEQKGKESVVQFLKFGLVGISNTLVDLIVTIALNAMFGIFYLAKIIGYSCGIMNSYAWNSKWTFKKEHKRDTREIVTFIIVNTVTLGISLLLQWAFRDKFNIGVHWMNFIGENWFSNLINGERFCLILASGIALIINFIGNKLFVFKAKVA